MEIYWHKVEAQAPLNYPFHIHILSGNIQTGNGAINQKSLLSDNPHDMQELLYNQSISLGLVIFQ